MAEEIEKKEDIATEDEVSLRDTIEAAYEEETAKDESGSQDGSTRESSSDDSSTSREGAKSTEPVRDASGKFLPKSPGVSQGDSKPIPESTHAILAPKELEGEEKAKFESLPRELQEYITKKETEIGSRHQEVESRAQEYAAIDKAYEPYAQKLQLQGFGRDQFVNQLSALYGALESDPASAIEWLKNTYGVQGEQQYQQPQQYAQQQSYQDPRLEAVTRELAQVKSYISGQQTSGLQSDYDTFRNMKDANGNLAHPYVDEIENEAAQFVPLVKQQNPSLSNVEVMKEAYERAVWSNPRTREAMQKGVAPTKQSQTSMIQRVNAAKRRAGSVTGAPRGGSEAVDSKDLSLRETIEAAYDGRLQ